MQVISSALRALGVALAPWLGEFDTVVLGGSMTRSWDVLGPPFVRALHSHGADPQIALAEDVEASALVGAARFVLDLG